MNAPKIRLTNVTRMRIALTIPHLIPVVVMLVIPGMDIFAKVRFAFFSKLFISRLRFLSP